jgi:hypothetical protein
MLHSSCAGDTTGSVGCRTLRHAAQVTERMTPHSSNESKHGMPIRMPDNTITTLAVFTVQVSVQGVLQDMQTGRVSCFTRSSSEMSLRK